MRSDAVEGDVVPLIGRMAFEINPQGPIIAPHRAIERVAGADHARDLRKPLLELLVQTVELLRLVSGEGGIHPYDQTALSLETKALVFQVSKRLGQQAGPNQQDG